MRTHASMLSLAVAISLAGAFAGCAIIPAVPKQSVTAATDDYNLALETAQNQMLLLNIARASKQHPMYFTALTDMKGSLSYGISGLGTKPYRSAADDKATFALTASISANPLFTIAPLSSKEFTSGMLAPLPPEIFGEFWNTGWHHELMFYLLLHSIEEPGQPALFNRPADKSFDGFREDVRKLVTEFDCRLELTKRSTQFGPPVSIASLEGLAELRKSDLKMEPTDNGRAWKAIAETSDYTVSCGNKDGNPLHKREYVLVTSPLDTAEEGNSKGKMVLRSPESVLYYLGEIMRYQELRQGKDIRLENLDCAGTKAPLLFQGRKATTAESKERENKKPHVRVTYEGEDYVIPWAAESEDLECATDESMHVLSFLSLLIAREQTGTTLPPPVGVSTLIGGR